MKRWEPLPPELESFPHFTCYLLQQLGLAESPTKQQLAVCEFMQSGPPKSVVSAFRGLGKSLLASLYACWRLRIDPDEKILVVSATAVKSNDFTTFMLRCIADVDVLQCLSPRLENRSSTTAFDVGPCVPEQSPSVRSLGVMGSTTGQRCSCAILDDVETLANVVTPFKQERIAHAIEELESILKPSEGQLLPRKILYLGTPHAQNSLYLRLSRERGYTRRVWPALYPESTEPYEGDLDPLIERELLQEPALVGLPTDPERFNEADVLARKASMTEATFRLQFQLDTRLALAEKYPIRLGDLVVADWDGTALPETVVWSAGAEYRANELVCVGLGADRHYHRPAFVGSFIPRKQEWRCILAIDPAGRGRDELAWAVVAELNGNLFLLDSGGTTKGYADEVLVHLSQLAKNWEVNLVLAESNFGDGMFSQLLKPVLRRIHPCTVEEVRSTSRKELRLVDTLAPVIQNHRLVVLARVLRQDYLGTESDPEEGVLRSLAYQLSRLTTEKGCLPFDDRADALALAVAHYTEAAALDQQAQADARRDELADAMYAAWMDEQGSHIDQLALGVRPDLIRAAGAGQGGFRRLSPRELVR